MCGIFGASFKAGTITPGRLSVFAANLGRYNDNRGGDSWGVCSIEDDGEISIERGLGNLANHGYTLADHRNFFGHTRLATVGKKTVENAHPFEIGNIIGAHNGAVYNHFEMSRKYERDFDVDSQHIFAHLNEGKDIGELTGYGAIEWINRKDPTRIFLCRMSASADLSIFGIGDRETNETIGIVWSSSEKHLIESLYASGIRNIFPFQVDEGVVNYVRDGEIYLSRLAKIELSRKQSITSSHYEDYYSRESGCSTTSTTTTSSSSSAGDDTEKYEAWKKERWGAGGQKSLPASSSSANGGADKDVPFHEPAEQPTTALELGGEG